ncbi:hypothetical protein ABK040_013991 [Willaertia magna]
MHKNKSTESHHNDGKSTTSSIHTEQQPYHTRQLCPKTLVEERDKLSGVTHGDPNLGEDQDFSYREKSNK